jgi:predicted transcriptional regulator
MTKHLMIAISDAEEAHLRATAEREAVSIDEVVSHLVQRQMEYDAWFRRKVQEGVDAADRGALIPHEEVVARMKEVREEILAKKAPE